MNLGCRPELDDQIMGRLSDVAEQKPIYGDAESLPDAAGGFYSQGPLPRLKAVQCVLGYIELPGKRDLAHLEMLTDGNKAARNVWVRIHR
jgi:hypothetical protein